MLLVLFELVYNEMVVVFGDLMFVVWIWGDLVCLLVVLVYGYFDDSSVW